GLDSNSDTNIESISAPETKSQIVSSMKKAQAVEGNMENDKYLSQDNNVAFPNGTNVTKENTTPLSSSPIVKAPSGWVT
ncbi:hypothetical protein KI387_044566, partial [Taxus chinensis]